MFLPLMIDHKDMANIVLVREKLRKCSEEEASKILKETADKSCDKKLKTMFTAYADLMNTKELLPAFLGYGIEGDLRRFK